MSDNELEALPESWSGLEACKTVWLYGNRLTQLPGDLVELPQLQCALPYTSSNSSAVHTADGEA